MVTFRIKTSGMRREIYVHPADETLSFDDFLAKWPDVECVCGYSNKTFAAKDGIILGAVLPQANISSLCHPVYGKSARLYSVRCFNELEQNCNTCVHLERVPFVKDRSGLMPGICHNLNSTPLYDRGDGNIMFAPEDWMGQSCHHMRA